MLKNQKLQNEVSRLKEELLKLRFQAAVGQLEHPHKIKAVKKEIAKLLTKINQENKGEKANG